MNLPWVKLYLWSVVIVFPIKPTAKAFCEAATILIILLFEGIKVAACWTPQGQNALKLC